MLDNGRLQVVAAVSAVVAVFAEDTDEDGKEMR